MVRKRKAAAASSISDRIRGTLDPTYREHSDIFYLMHELSRLISVYFDRAMEAHALTHAQWWALMHIFEREGLTQTDLAEIMQMGRASTGKLLERLESKRWIERRADPSDNRVRRVFLREAAGPVFLMMTQEGRRLFKTFLKGIGARDEDRLLVELRKIKRNAEAWKRAQDL